MNEAVFAATAGLWFISLSYIVFSARYHYKTRHDRELDSSAQLYKWAITLGAVAIFILSTLMFANEFGWLSKEDQRELGLIWRLLFGAKIIVAFAAVGLKFGRVSIVGTVLISAVAYVYKVLQQ